MYIILLITLLCKSAHQSYTVELCQVIYLQSKYNFHFDLNDITMTLKRIKVIKTVSMGEALKTKLYCHDKTDYTFNSTKKIIRANQTYINQYTDSHNFSCELTL